VCASCWRQQLALQMLRRLLQAGWLSWQLRELAQHGSLQLRLELVVQAGNVPSWCSAAACGRFLVVNAELAVAGGGGGRHAMAASSHLHVCQVSRILFSWNSQDHLLRRKEELRVAAKHLLKCEDARKAAHS
jgi:hypothetical protein